MLNVNHLQAIRMDQLTTVRFDTKVLRPPRVFAFHPPSVLTSSVLAPVQKIGEVILCKPSLAHASCHEIKFSNEEQIGFVIGARDTLPIGQVTFFAGNPKVHGELEKRWPVYSMMNHNERITVAQQMMGERRLTAHALQTHNGVKHDVDRISEGAGGKHRSMGSVTMRSENSHQVDGAKSQSPVRPNLRHANIANLQSPTSLESLYSMPALHEMEPTPNAPEVGPMNARVSPYPAPKPSKEGEGKGLRPRSKGPKKD